MVDVKLGNNVRKNGKKYEVQYKNDKEISKKLVQN